MMTYIPIAARELDSEQKLESISTTLTWALLIALGALIIILIVLTTYVAAIGRHYFGLPGPMRPTAPLAGSNSADRHHSVTDYSESATATGDSTTAGNPPDPPRRRQRSISTSPISGAIHSEAAQLLVVSAVEQLLVHGVAHSQSERALVATWPPLRVTIPVTVALSFVGLLVMVGKVTSGQ
ncbi:hypothetical protein C8Q76DRAFT_757903 [Earliella scabrosa]|nr:hypothetical protein C8Q76DRAFT_757903 [Earliella scabrosa]